MRSYSLLFFFLTACASTSTNPPESPNQSPPIALACSTSVADYCASNNCDQSLAAAEQDKNLCPATLTRCGEYDVVKGGSNVITHWYYRSGNLAAITREVVPNRYTCLAGPSTFHATCCAGSGQTLPACSP